MDLTCISTPSQDPSTAAEPSLATSTPPLHHSSTTVPSNTCDICGKTLSSKRNVARQMKNIHGKVKIKIVHTISILTSFSQDNVFVETPSTASSPATSASTSAMPSGPPSAPLSRRRRSLSSHKTRASARRK